MIESPRDQVPRHCCLATGSMSVRQRKNTANCHHCQHVRPSRRRCLPTVSMSVQRCRNRSHLVLSLLCSSTLSMSVERYRDRSQLALSRNPMHAKTLHSACEKTMRRLATAEQQHHATSHAVLPHHETLSADNTAVPEHRRAKHSTGVMIRHRAARRPDFFTR